MHDDLPATTFTQLQRVAASIEDADSRTPRFEEAAEAFLDAFHREVSPRLRAEWGWNIVTLLLAFERELLERSRAGELARDYLAACAAVRNWVTANHVQDAVRYVR